MAPPDPPPLDPLMVPSGSLEGVKAASPDASPPIADRGP